MSKNGVSTFCYCCNKKINDTEEKLSLVVCKKCFSNNFFEERTKLIKALKSEHIYSGDMEKYRPLNPYTHDSNSCSVCQLIKQCEER